MTGPGPLSAARVIVPDLLGLDWHLARTMGEEAGLWVTGPDPDGPPLAAVGWPGGVVIRQRPEPGADGGNGGDSCGRNQPPAGARR